MLARRVEVGGLGDLGEDRRIVGIESATIAGGGFDLFGLEDYDFVFGSINDTVEPLSFQFREVFGRDDKR